MSWFYPTWFKHLITESNNETPSAAKVAGLLGTISFFGLSFYAVVVNHSPFAAADYGVGLGSIIATTGLAVGLGKAGEAPVGH